MIRELKRLIFLRHGLTLPQQQHRYCGQMDPPLAPEGRRQIMRLRDGRAWPGEVVCSDLRRSIETASRLLPHVSPRIRTEWREINFGAWEGLTWEETGCKDPDLLRHPDFCFPRGETMIRLQARVERGLRDVLQTPAEECLVIAHQGSIAAAITLLLQTSLPTLWDYSLPCGGFRILERTGTEWGLQKDDERTPEGVA